MTGRSLGQFNLWIDADFVITHFGLQASPVFARDDNLFGFLQRHVACDAVLVNRVSQSRKRSALLRLMALQAIQDEGRNVALWGVHVVTSCTRERRAGLKTATLLQQLHLAAVNVHLRAPFWLR